MGKAALALPSEPRIADRAAAIKIMDILLEDADEDGAWPRLEALQALRDAIASEII